MAGERGPVLSRLAAAWRNPAACAPPGEQHDLFEEADVVGPHAEQELASDRV